jgi:hypothetical protein
MNQLLSIVDDKIVINKLRLTYLEGNLIHAGHFNLQGDLSASNITASGTITADTIRVKRIIDDSAQQTDAFTFVGTEESQLDNKGLVWGVEDTYFQLVLRTEPRRIYSSETIDIASGKSYQIDGVDALLKGRLGSSIKTSSLTEIGILNELNVDGNTNLGNTVIVNSYLNRVGINTEIPNAALSINENGIEVVVGTDENRAIIGTWGNNTLDIITDNTSRISIQGNTVTFGSEISKNAVVKINGTLEVDSIVSDVRVQRTAPIEFLEDADSGVYGKGLSWRSKSAPTRQFFLMPSPDRFYSSESIDLRTGMEFSIGKQLVIDSDRLGSTVKESSLETLGTLRSLSVGGPVDLNGAISIQENEAVANRTFSVASGDVKLTVTSDSIDASDSLRVTVKGTQEFAVNDANIVIGNKNNTTRTVNAYGRVSVNITNPDPNAAFSVDGMVVMNDKRFTSSDSMPEHGDWNVGDISYNTTPQTGSYIGWVCVSAGNPGVWKPFGLIA